MCCDWKSLINDLLTLITAAFKLTNQELGALSNRFDEQSFLTGVTGENRHDGPNFHRVKSLILIKKTSQWIKKNISTKLIFNQIEKDIKYIKIATWRRRAKCAFSRKCINQTPRLYVVKVGGVKANCVDSECLSVL